jgi:plastocyanin
MSSRPHALGRLLTSATAVSLAFCTAAGSASAAKVRAIDFAFKPGTVRVERGEKVVWKNVEGSHTVTFRKGRFDRELEGNDRVSRKFTKKGTFAYYCRPHRSEDMKGKVVVGKGSDGGRGGGGGGEGGGRGGGGGGGGGGDEGGSGESSPPIVAGPGAASSGYATPSVTVERGGSLSFLNLDYVEHDVNSEEKGPDGRPLFSTPLIGFGESAEVEGLDRVQSGQSYGFFCSVHPGMRGTLRVR